MRILQVTLSYDTAYLALVDDLPPVILPPSAIEPIPLLSKYLFVVLRLDEIIL